MAIGKGVNNIFTLVHHFGNEEDQVSANFAFILWINKNFLVKFLNDCLRLNVNSSRHIDIETQVVYPKEKSKVDIQITLGNKFAVIIESKIWTNKPSHGQLMKYAGILRELKEEERYKEIRLVLITQFNEADSIAELQDKIVASDTLIGVEFCHFRWKELIELFVKSRSAGKVTFINNLFLEYLGDKMADKKIIREQRIKDVKEVLINSTDDDWWDHVRKTMMITQGNNTPDAQYVAIYRTYPVSAITHVAKVKYTENNLLPRETFKDYPKIIQKGIKRKWIDIPHKVYHLEELIELPIPIKKDKGDRGVVRNKWFKNLTDLLKAKKLSDLTK